MKFPSELRSHGRRRLPNDRFASHHFLYARHKPSSDWNEEDGLPDFTRVKLDQSFNWCLLSIPVWTRFNEEREYLADYAVAAFSVFTIRESHRYTDAFESQVLDVEHVPLEDNYSHSELVCLSKLDKTQRREIRMTLRHNCRVPLKPNQKRSPLGILLDLARMYGYRALSRLNPAKT